MFERWSSYLRCHLQDGGVVAVEMGDPVVCTLVLVRDISLSLALSLALYFGSNLVSATDREPPDTVNHQNMYVL